MKRDKKWHVEKTMWVLSCNCQYKQYINLFYGEWLIKGRKAKESLDRKYPLRTIALQQQQLFPLQKVRLTVSHSDLGSYTLELGLRRGFCCGLSLAIAVGASAYMTRQKRRKEKKTSKETYRRKTVGCCSKIHRCTQTGTHRLSWIPRRTGTLPCCSLR